MALSGIFPEELQRNSIISVSGPQNSGKSTLVADILKLSVSESIITPEITYRDIIRRKQLTINQRGSFESQKEIMDFMVEQLEEYYSEKKYNNKIIILDRSILDCFVYSKFLYYNKKMTSGEFQYFEDLYLQGRCRWH